MEEKKVVQETAVGVNGSGSIGKETDQPQNGSMGTGTGSGTNTAQIQAEQGGSDVGLQGQNGAGTDAANLSGPDDLGAQANGQVSLEANAAALAPEEQKPGQLTELGGLLDEWRDKAAQGQRDAIDYATEQGVLELERAHEDAQEQFQNQLDQTDREEAQALDNQALYAEARGDRGGIGQAQYAQIQSTAMQNRRAIRTARVKLATDTARQIADLRARGEFEKADAVLQLTQEHLVRLIELQQWGAEYALNWEQFQKQLEQWEAEFGMAESEITGVYKGQPTLAASENERRWLAESGHAALEAGVRPSPEQQAAMGYTDEQIATLMEKAEPKGADDGPRGPLTNLSVDPEQKIYIWGGRKYETIDSMIEAINKTGLTDEEIAELNENAKRYNLWFEVER